jgi:hypothetical protein
LYRWFIGVESTSRNVTISKNSKCRNYFIGSNFISGFHDFDLSLVVEIEFQRFGFFADETNRRVRNFPKIHPVET